VGRSLLWPVVASSPVGNLRAYIAVLTPLIWGTTYLTTTQLLPPDRPMLAGTLRALPAGIVLVLLGRRLPHGWWGRMVLLSVLYVSAFFPLLFLAAYRLPGGVASVINSLAPIGVTLLSVPVLGTRIRPIHLVGGALGVLGVALLVLRSSARLDWLGVAAMTTGVLMMVVATVLTKHWGRPPGMGPLPFTGWTFLLGGLVLAPVTLAVEGLPASLTLRNVAGYAYLSVFGAVISYGLWFWCLDRLPASAASFLGLVNPVFAAVLGWVVLEQALNGWQLTGALLVLVSVVLGQWGAISRRPGPNERQPRPQRVPAS
jgi:probable blue pigment (indigoidine) exporter